MSSFIIGALLVLSASTGSATNDDTLLLQVNGQGEEDGVTATEEVDRLLASPESIYNGLADKVGALEQDLAEMRQRNEVNLASQVKMYKKLLEEQAANNTALSNANDAVKADIESLTATNAEKRQAAKDVMKEHQDLSDGLVRIRKLIETNQEFVGRSLEKNADKDIPELKILADLEEQDKAGRTVAEHRNRLQAIDAEISNELHHRSMLQVGAPSKVARVKAPDGGNAPAAELVKGLGSGLSEFALRAKEGESQLKARFTESYKIGDVRHAELLEEQTSLEASRAKLKNLGQRLSSALAELQKRRTSLQESTRSVQGFMTKLGSAQ